MTSTGHGATAVLEELIKELGDRPGPVERIIGEWRGADAAEALGSIDRGVVRQTALEVVEELGKTWGATGDPSWVDGFVPGRPDDHATRETDYMFSLYRRAGIYAYARLRGEDSDSPSSVGLVLGVLRKPADHG